MWSNHFDFSKKAIFEITYNFFKIHVGIQLNYLNPYSFYPTIIKLAAIKCMDVEGGWTPWKIQN